MKGKFASIGVAVIVLVVAAAIIFGLTHNFWLGLNGWGPVRTVDTVVTKTYIDHGEQNQSHYMVGTESGVFEVDNGWNLGVSNADEIYAKMKEGHKYHLTTKGNKLVWYFGIQNYPYIIKVEEIKQ